ncbi:MAG TPA: hypothetical protein VFN62_09875 [Acidobacteriaceae bacterium]|nr:hypothetical protein [Acidobacteriaceae bacterium]
MVFKHILWMFVCLRLLGAEPAVPRLGDSLVQYAATLEIEYCRRRVTAGSTACREAGELAGHLIRLLGLPQAAEPLPPTLLPLLLRHSAK